MLIVENKSAIDRFCYRFLTKFLTRTNLFIFAYAEKAVDESTRECSSEKTNPQNIGFAMDLHDYCQIFKNIILCYILLDQIYPILKIIFVF